MSGLTNFLAFVVVAIINTKLTYNQVCKTVCSGTGADVNSVLQDFHLGSPGDTVNEVPKVRISWGQFATPGPRTQNNVLGAGDGVFSVPRISNVTSNTIFRSKPQNLPTFSKKQRKCDIIHSGIDSKGKETILQFHNTLRAKIANGKQSQFPPAGNMNQLFWNEEMAKQAQELADTCVMKHREASTAKYGKLGQNLYWASSSRPLSYKSVFSSGISKWYNEHKLFNPQTIKDFHYDWKYGHFTQVVWANTEFVGCGYTQYKDGGMTSDLFVCNYGPAGNVETIGRPVSLYIPANACASCPSDCSKTVKGLCDM